MIKNLFRLKPLAFMGVLFSLFFGDKEQTPGSNVHQSVYKLSSTQIQDEVEQIPILCYHNLTEINNTNITVSRIVFEEQIKSLYDSGYRSILPDELCNYITNAYSIPKRSIIISFDDSRVAQSIIAEPILRKFKFKALFFIETCCLNKPGYMSYADVDELCKKGHTIGAHTYDHKLVNILTGDEWEDQLLKPKMLLEKITGHPVKYFAYPYGIWSDQAIKKLKSYEYKAAFQLSGIQNKYEPLFTIRRLMVSGHWNANTLHRHIKQTFPGN